MNLRRFAWPIGITAAAVLGALVPAPAVRDAVTLAPKTGAHLVRPLAYSLVAPLSDVLDAMSLLSVPQLIAFAVSLIVCYAAWRLWRRRAHATSAWCEFCVGLRALLLLVLVVLLAAWLPRPMAALRIDEPDAIVFDVHSHTNWSHDARAGFTVEANRAWHRAAGFDAAYITDHRCFDGAAEGMRANPKRAGDGTVLLSGIELAGDRHHQIVFDRPTVEVDPKLLEDWCVRAGKGTLPAAQPVVIQTIPEDLSWLASTPASHVVLTGIEISDGAPRGIAQGQRDAALIVGTAQRLDLALLAGSNNHGWGRTAVAWNVMLLKGWRDLSPDSLAARLEIRFRAARIGAVTVVARRTPDGARPVGLALTLPLMLLDMARTISWPERAAWIAWAWLAWWLITTLRRPRT